MILEYYFTLNKIRYYFLFGGLSPTLDIELEKAFTNYQSISVFSL